MEEQRYRCEINEAIKIYLLVIVVGGLTTFIGIFLLPGSTSVLPIYISFAGIGVLLVGLALLDSGMKCQSCGTRLLIYAMAKYPVGSWFMRLLSITECPTCGSSMRSESGES